MFTINSLKVILELTSLFFVTCDFTLGAQRKCAEYNEYCQEHWECCSNTCLTYSYRCIGKKHSTPTFERPTLTLEQLLEGIAEVNTIPPTTTHRQTQSEPSMNALNPMFDVRTERRVVKTVPLLHKIFTNVERNSEIVMGSQEPTLTFFVLQPEVLIPQSKLLIQEIQPVHDEAADKSSIVKATDKPEITAESATEQMLTTQCKEIGEKCYRHEECCTQRCHGFLHQCVT